MWVCFSYQSPCYKYLVAPDVGIHCAGVLLFSKDKAMLFTFLIQRDYQSFLIIEKLPSLFLTPFKKNAIRVQDKLRYLFFYKKLAKFNLRQHVVDTFLNLV